MQAQFADTLHKAFAGKKRFEFGFDSRNSFIDNKVVSVQSIKLGVGFNDRVSIGGGLAFLTSVITDKYIIHDNKLDIDTAVTRKLDFAYFCYYVEYTYYKTRHWEFSIPMQFGIGSINYAYTYNGIRTITSKTGCFLYEPEVNAKYRFCRWLGLEADIGYRIVLKNDAFVKRTFNSPLFSFGFFILWDEVALSVFKKNKFVQRKLGPSDW